MGDIVARVKALLLQPAQEWPVIAAESIDTKSLILGYAAIVSLIPAVMGFIVTVLLGNLAQLQVSIGAMLANTVAQYVLGLVSLWLLGKIIQSLVPMFGGLDDEVAAMKLSVYPPTAVWIAGIFVPIPVAGVLVVLLGLAYSIYIFYLGAPPVAKVPADKAVLFTIAVSICSILLSVVIGLLTARLFLG